MDRPATDSDDLEDIRFAVVMNGGVSLAIWIGGVTAEINRLAESRPRAGGGAYEGLLDIVRATARVDIISGTSAGGINGAFLALATVYGLDLQALGDLWAKQGSFSDLLRGPLEKDPPSLLRGDDYFLVRLREALDDLFPKDWESAYRPPDEAPVNLTITSTLLEGEPAPFIDDFGTRLTEIDHRARFKFVRSDYTRTEDDPFHSPAVVRHLALAGRSTASFPAAFEPSFVPVSGPGPDGDHPDMREVVSFPHSRFVLDGGVLMNQPIKPALEAIMAQPAHRQVRRILAYVNPDPRADVTPGPPHDPKDMPTMAKVLLNSLVTLPGSQSVKEELQEIVDHNRRVRDRRQSRVDLVSALGPDLHSLAERLFDSYRRVRRRRSISWIATTVANVLVEQPRPTGDPGAEPPPAWTREELVAAFERSDFTLIPKTLPSANEPVSTLDWGLSPVERLGALGVDVFKRAIWLAPFADPALRGRLRAQRLELHKHLRSVRAMRSDDLKFWREEVVTREKGAVTSLPAPPAISSDRPKRLTEWASDALRRWPVWDRKHLERREEILRSLEFVARGIVQVLIQSGEDLRRIVEEAKQSADSGWREEAERLENLLELILGPFTAIASVDSALRQLMFLEVCQVTLGGDDQDVQQDVALIQFSGNCDTSFIDRTMTTAEKLAGANLAHFAAFYKEGWRVSDWIWGRLDGSTRLCQAVLSPNRLRQFGGTSSEAYDLIRRVAVEDAPELDQAELELRFPEDSCKDELRFLSDRTVPVPPSLPSCAMAIARRIHLEILRVELPRLEIACRLDLKRGAGDRGLASAFLTSYETRRAQHPNGQLSAKAVFDLFKEARIGEERIADEIPSDLMASTVSTAAAVAVSAIQSDRSGMGPIRILGRALRGYTLALYALTTSATAGGFGATAVSFALALGGACIALSLIGNAPTLIGTTGATLLLAGIAVAALRTKFRGFAFILGLIAAAIIAFGLWDAGGLSSLMDRGRELLIIGGLVVLGLILGGISSKKRPRLPSR
jgi:patatin-related protein